MVEDAFQGCGVREEFAFLLAVGRPIMYEVATLPVFCLDIGEVVDNLYFAVQDVGNLHLRTVENLSVVLLLDTELAEPLCHNASVFRLYQVLRSPHPLAPLAQHVQ